MRAACLRIGVVSSHKLLIQECTEGSKKMKNIAFALMLAIVSAGASAAITIVNESSIVLLPDAPFTATIVGGQAGQELVVAGVASDKTTTGERLTGAELNFVAVDAGGTVLGTGIASLRTGNRLEWRVLVKPSGMFDANLVAQIKVTDRKIDTAERQEKEARERDEGIRQAEAERERKRREANKPDIAADCIAKSKDAVGCFVEQVNYRFLSCKLNVQLTIVGGAGDISNCSISGDRALADFYAAAIKKFAKNKAAQSMTKDYYAFWKSSMGALVPSGEMTRGGWAAQTAKLEADLTQKGERLQLEK